MSGLSIYMSNRTEILAEQLADVLRVPGTSALEPEIVVIQSRGMQRWLSLAISRRNGICANIEFPFPKTFLCDMACRLAPDLDHVMEDDPAKVIFRLMGFLPDFLSRREFQRLNHYLADDDQGLKLFQLCQRIASLFDQYQVYRPELLHRWEEGQVDNDRHSRWQAKLWRNLHAGTDAVKKILWPQKLSDAIDKDPLASDRLPSRAFIFGISYLPPLYLELISRLSRVMHLSLFWMNPSREYWGDIVSERQANRWHRRVDQDGTGLYLESGNRLLAAFGALGRNFMRMLVDCDGQIFEHYEEPSAKTMLANLQSDILYLRNRGGGAEISNSAESEMSRVNPIDASIQVHNCHSPLREMEVLHDNLLALFEADPELKPGDIIVMAPDIETYAPYIQAVFGTRTRSGTTIPFSIADRSARRTNGMVDGFMALLDMADSRFGAAEVFRLLEFPGIKERFGLESAELIQIEHWVNESQIRWGTDASMREETGLPAFKENSWSEGFRRLLLGYAMPTEEQALFKGILPFDHIEGRDTVTLGNFIDFATRLFDLKADLGMARSMSEWQSTFEDILEGFFSISNDRQRELQLLRQTILDLATSAGEAEFNLPVELPLLRNWLQELLQNASGSGGFLGQGVTFCALLPMRSIPFKAVCLIGMDSAGFPRDSQPMEFDLMAREPKPGDRSRRDDDRYLFLEAMLSARDTLYVSYVGQNITDNSTIPPSVLVRELLDTLEPAEQQPDRRMSDELIVHHRLQPFSIDYFSDDTNLFSYSRASLEICQRLGEPQSQEPFFDGPLPLAGNEEDNWRQIDLGRLALYWGHPCRFLLRQRFGITLEAGQEQLQDFERFNLTGLERYHFGEKLLRRRIDQPDPPDQYPLWAASGQLPPANTGRLAYDQLAGEVETFAARLRASPIEAERVRLDIDHRNKDLRLSGCVPNAYPDGCIIARFANTKARDLLQAWICHLGYGISSDHKNPVSYLYCKDSVWVFNPVINSHLILNDLMDLYFKGLTEPIAFVPQAAYAFAEARLRRNQPDDAALRSAKKVWQGNDYAPGEAQDPYVQLCYRQRDLFSEEFRVLALQVYEPLFQHLDQVML